MKESLPSSYIQIETRGQVLLKREGLIRRTEQQTAEFALVD